MSKPDWDALYDAAAAQQGYFTTAQAATAGFSRPLLTHRLRTGWVTRARRGIYRLVHFPEGEHEDLVVLWLWSERRGVFSHETALALHDLSDALPAATHLTLPAAWEGRRLRVPDGVLLHYADLGEGDATWRDAVPITSPARTVNDCVAANVPPELVQQAVEQGLSRGLFAREEVRAALRYGELGPEPEGAR